MIGMGIVPTLLIGVDSEKPNRIDIIDESDFFYDELSESLDDSLKDGSKKFLIDRVELTDSVQAIIDAQRARVESEDIDGFIHIPVDIVKEGKLDYYAKNVANFDINRRLRGAIGEIVINHRLEASGLVAEEINKLTKSLSLKTYKIVKGGTQAESGFLTEYLTTFAFVIILYITIFGYGANVMREIIQEKTTRIIEVLLSSANPFQMMAGKILGQGSVGLTQYLIWSAIGVGLITYGGSMMPVSAGALNIAPEIFLYFILFYILGFFIFSSMYAAIGAITTTEQEAQQVSAPIVFILIIPLMLIGFMVKNPDSTMITVLSYIPFFTPIIMFTRINLSTPSSFEILASIILLILTVLVLIWLTAKIYRIGILMYGKRPTLPEIWKWIQTK
jgi:ABC-2 type transport system permease protein